MFRSTLGRLCSRRSKSPRSQRTVIRDAATSWVESLESRRMLTVMTVNGTAGADTIILSAGGGVVTANVNGNASVQSDLLVTSVVINGSDGDDTIIINSNGTNDFTVNAGIGNPFGIFLARGAGGNVDPQGRPRV